MRNSSLSLEVTPCEKLSEKTSRMKPNSFDTLILGYNHKFSTQRYSLKILHTLFKEDDQFYDFPIDVFEIKISRKDMMEFLDKISKKHLKNSGIILSMEKVSPLEIHTKLIRHNDARWGDTICIANIISPHLIFVKRSTSTYKNFQFTLPDNIEQIEWIDSDETKLEDSKYLNLKDCIGYYVLAPLMEDIYVRARIIDASSDKLFMKVIYIDYGTISWVGRTSLALMDQSLFKFRWQVRPVALNNIYPYSNGKKSLQNTMWNKEHIKAVKNVLSNSSLYKFTHYNRLKRIYAADISPVELFSAENDSKSTNIAAVNEILVNKYGDLFCRNDIHNQPLSNVLLDISDDCDEKLDIEKMPPWKLNFPPDEKISKQSNDYTSINNSGTIGNCPDFWTVKNLKDKGFLINGECIVVFLQSPMDDSHPLRLGGYLISCDEINLLREKVKEERKNGVNEIIIKRLLSEICYKVRITTFDKIRNYSEQYKNQTKNVSIKIDDIISEWRNNRPFYIVTERKAKNSELMFFRAEVTGFHKEINYFLLRIRYLDFNGTGVCCMHETYKLLEDTTKDMPYNIGFSYDDILIKNENITGDDNNFLDLVNDVKEKLPYSEPIMIKLNLNGNKESYPNEDKYSKCPLIVDNRLQTDFKINSMWKIENLNENGTFAINPIKFNNTTKKYSKCFREEASILKPMIEFYTKYNFEEYEKKYHTNIYL